jgi:hypothetical protein
MSNPPEGCWPQVWNPHRNAKFVGNIPLSRLIRSRSSPLLAGNLPKWFGIAHLVLYVYHGMVMGSVSNFVGERRTMEV